MYNWNHARILNMPGVKNNGYSFLFALTSSLGSLLDKYFASLEKSTRTSGFQSNEPPPKFIRPSFPYEEPLGKRKNK